MPKEFTPKTYAQMPHANGWGAPEVDADNPNGIAQSRPGSKFGARRVVPPEQETKWTRHMAKTVKQEED